MARGPNPQHVISLTAQEHAELKRLTRLWETASYAQVVRAKIVLLAYEHPNWDNATIARKVGCTDRTVRHWRRRWRDVASLREAARPGAPRFFSLCPTSPDHRPRLHAS